MFLYCITVFCQFKWMNSLLYSILASHRCVCLHLHPGGFPGGLHERGDLPEGITPGASVLGVLPRGLSGGSVWGEFVVRVAASQPWCVITDAQMYRLQTNWQTHTTRTLVVIVCISCTQRGLTYTGCPPLIKSQAFVTCSMSSEACSLASSSRLTWAACSSALSNYNHIHAAQLNK